MRKFFILGAVFIVSVAMIMTSCHKDESNDNSNNNTENPSGGNQEYPPTAVVIHNAVSDIDGNSYDAVQIGNQVWMAENLRTTRYADGGIITEGTSTSTSTNTPLRYTPSTDVATYGYLYNWKAVMRNSSSSSVNPSGVQGVCPTGWHVPSDAEWSQMIAYLSSHSEYVCNGSGDNIAKALASENGWPIYNGDEYVCAIANNPSANNSTGFSAFPAGYYYGSTIGGFGIGAYFWSATGTGSSFNNAYLHCIEAYNTNVVKREWHMYYGLSVRCVRD